MSDSKTGFSKKPSIEGISTAYDYCVACALQAGCEFAGFFTPTSPVCILVRNRQQTCTDTYSLDLSLPLRYVGINGCRNANYGFP